MKTVQLIRSNLSASAQFQNTRIPISRSGILTLAILSFSAVQSDYASLTNYNGYVALGTGDTIRGDSYVPVATIDGGLIAISKYRVFQATASTTIQNNVTTDVFPMRLPLQKGQDLWHLVAASTNLTLYTDLILHIEV